MQRSHDRILTTHVGSLPRPTDLDDALERRAEDEGGYGAALHRAVADVVDKQVDAEVDVVNDGEIADAIVRNAPATDDHFFLVPKVVE